MNIHNCKVCHGSNLIEINGMVICTDCETVHYFINGKLVWDFDPITREYIRDDYRNRKSH